MAQGAPAQPAWHSTVSGAVAAVCCVYAGLPFDTVKVRLQTGAARAGMVAVARDLVRNEGARALFKGATPALASAGIENTVLFTANTISKRVWVAGRTWLGVPGDPSHFALWELACVGGMSGVFSATAICPAEQVKCRLQVHKGANVSPLGCAIAIAREHGITALYRGWGALLLRDVPFCFCFFGCYEAFCSLLCLRGDRRKAEMHPLETMLAGGLAGSVGWAVVFPMDVIKTRQQTSNARFVETLRHLRTLPVREVYRGVVAAMTRSVPANGALFLGYETAHKALLRWAS